jgi:hypothetical protein
VNVRDLKLFGSILLFGGVPVLLISFAAILAAPKKQPEVLSTGLAVIGLFVIVLCAAVWWYMRSDDRSVGEVLKELFKVIASIFLVVWILAIVLTGVQQPHQNLAVTVLFATGGLFPLVILWLGLRKGLIYLAWLTGISAALWIFTSVLPKISGGEYIAFLVALFGVAIWRRLDKIEDALRRK